MELAQIQPEKPAVVFRKEMLTYEALSQIMAHMGRFLTSQGIGRGSRVLFSAVSKPEAICALLGIQSVGATAVGLGRDASAKDSCVLYDETKADLCLTDRALENESGNCRVESLHALFTSAVEQAQDSLADVAENPVPDPEDIAEMIFTTGTTGKPKGVMLSFRAVYQISKNTIDGIGIFPEDRVLVPLPLHHSLALREVRAALWQGATVVLQNGFRFAGELEKNISELGCTGMVTVPASLDLVRTQLGESFSSVLGKLRYMEVGAGSLSVRQRKEYTKLLPGTRLNNTWGSSETGGALFLRVNEAAKDPVMVSSIGKPLEGVTIRVLDTEGNEILSPDSENPGRLALKGDMVMSGYWNRPMETADALRGDWLVTNDLVYTDKDGYAYMLGRVDDIINVGGEKVSPIEVENLAGEYSAIKECACIGVPDETLGQIPVLFYVQEEDFSMEEWKRYLTKCMAKYMVPRAFVPVNALPRNPMQKLDRRAMRAMWSQMGAKSE